MLSGGCRALKCRIRGNIFGFQNDYNGKQAGDSDKASAVMINIAERDDAPYICFWVRMLTISLIKKCNPSEKYGRGSRCCHRYTIGITYLGCDNE